MPDSLSALEQQRFGILMRILQLGDFRSGSITAIKGRCGKPNCHCHQPGQPGHGPNFRLTRKVDGKTVSESFSSPAELRKAQREVEAFHHFRQLSQDLLEINERICRARPVAVVGGSRKAEVIVAAGSGPDAGYRRGVPRGWRKKLARRSWHRNGTAP